ncbi:SWI/SNF complex component SNF12-like [Vitis vinifera]|uniref:SWI/SNF complex component SNF12-like n=1 Tax=Vitis vinifera TaxID=29760 RepID=A0A438K965_VITVI|nr:SWI/SNF complex component SNF12-like [Vitis vinifera]
MAMSANHNKTPGKSVGLGSVSSGNVGQTMPLNHQPHLLSQSQPQTLGGTHFPGHFQLSEPQAQALAQTQYAQAHAQAQAQAAHAQFQAQLQAQAQSLAQLHSAGLVIWAFPRPLFRPQPGGRSQSFQKSKYLIKLLALVPESAIYTQLVELEARVDAALARKKTDIQESLKNPHRVQKTLRIYVFNTFANQTRMNLEKTNAEPPSWTLKIIGRILEDGGLYPDNHVILWENARSPTLHEGFEVQRKGDKEFNAIIRLEMNYVPEKFKLSTALSEVLGLEVDTRPRIVAAIWHYVKSRKLQKPE